MQCRLYLHLSVLGASGHSALLPCGIVVERSSCEASLLIAADTTRDGFPAIHLVLKSTVLQKLFSYVQPLSAVPYVRHLRLANAEFLGKRVAFAASIIRRENF
jgi:hypothetical protein